MATVLEMYQSNRQSLYQKISEGNVTPHDLWICNELTYRISVLETFRIFSASAPSTTNTKTLQGHYKKVDAFIQHIAQERGYGPNRGPDTEKERNAARTNLDRVIQDYRKQFSSFVPSSDETYGWRITDVMKTVTPVWLQMRETFVPLKERKREGSTNDK